MPTRQYSSRSQQSTLTSAITAGAATISVVSGTALLGGVTIPAGRTYTLVIDVDTALEEIVDATAVSTNTFTITRAIDGSSAQSHSAGAVVRHMAIGRDFRDANLHTQASASYNDGAGNAQSMHGIGSGEGDVVGTDKTQTLTAKTLTSPTISNPTFTGTPLAAASISFEGATADAHETILTVVDPTQDNTITLPNTTGTVVIVDATQTLTNKTLTSPTISGSPVITGLSSAGMSASSAAPKDYVDSILGSATSAATSAASAATSATSAATSATSASNSATASASSASAAATSATSAATSATSAAASATAAATSATSAAASEAGVTASASAAATSAASASTSASSALTSANSASTSASSASTSASSAATSATSAGTSATSAAASATAAGTSASSASTSASSALTSANSAATSAASAAAAVAASFDAKGDLLVGTGAQAFDQLTVASTNGYILSVASTTATGLQWIAAGTGTVSSITAGTGLSGGTITTTGTIAIDSTVATLTGSQTLTNKTLTAPVISSISNTGTVTLPTATDTLVGRATTDTLTNKTLTTPVIASISNSGTITIPTGTDTLVGRATTDTLTNKTLTSPTITTPTQRLTLNAQTGTTYTLVAADATYKLVTASNAAAITITVPPSVFTVGDVINVQQIGAGQVTFSQGSGVTITSTGATSTAPKLRVQYSSASIICTTTSTGFTIVGDIA